MPSEPAHVSIDVADVERIAALGWRGLEEAQLGGWLLRAAGGFTGRSNSALVLGTPPKTAAWLPDLVRWYADRGLPPMVQIPMPGGEAIDAMLDASGWRTHDLVRFLTGDLSEVQKSTARALARPSEGRPVSDLLAQGALHSNGSGVIARLDPEPDDAWLAAYHYRGAPLPGHAREVLVRAEEGTELRFASLRAPAPDGAAAAVLAVARGAVARGWLGVTAVTVNEGRRRQGHGTRLMAELANWADERGARAIYLQVAADNSSALRLYSRLGFHHHHDYRYRIGPVPEDRSA
ncbi:MAG: GNAT family N-acetyltransferase [Geodermatophilaceae bacterium]